MQKVKEISKKATAFTDSQKKGGGESHDLSKCMELKDAMTQGKKMSENSVSQLMAEEVAPYISNSRDLIDKMLSYQEIFEKALPLVDAKIESLGGQDSAKKASQDAEIDSPNFEYGGAFSSRARAETQKAQTNLRSSNKGIFGTVAEEGPDFNSDIA